MLCFEARDCTSTHFQLRLLLLCMQVLTPNVAVHSWMVSFCILEARHAGSGPGAVVVTVTPMLSPHAVCVVDLCNSVVIM